MKTLTIGAAFKEETGLPEIHTEYTPTISPFEIIGICELIKSRNKETIASRIAIKVILEEGLNFPIHINQKAVALGKCFYIRDMCDRIKEDMLNKIEWKMGITNG